MPGYPFLAKTPLRYNDIVAHLETNQTVGVPYTSDMVINAKADLEAQLDADSDGAEAMAERYPGAIARNFDTVEGVPSELDALIAYLQVLGTMVDFSVYKAEENLR
jgi:cytochrome c oxidase cbb3-type subunit 2